MRYILIMLIVVMMGVSVAEADNNRPMPRSQELKCQRGEYVADKYLRECNAILIKKLRGYENPLPIQTKFEQQLNNSSFRVPQVRP